MLYGIIICMRSLCLVCLATSIKLTEMCGIVGFINSRCELNLDLLGHRGPDNLGIYKNAGVKLGHARLSIQDTSDASNQPFISEDGRYVLVYNGEIYNHYELRLKLEAKGKIFKSSGDTETVLVSLIEWGKDALDQFVRARLVRHCTRTLDGAPRLL